MEEAKVESHHSPFPAPRPVDEDSPRHCAPATSASAAETRPSELPAEEERGLRHQGRSHFPQVLLSASHHPQFRITPLDRVCSESIIPSQKTGGRAHVGSNYEREIGHSVTNIYLFLFQKKKMHPPCHSFPA